MVIDIDMVVGRHKVVVVVYLGAAEMYVAGGVGADALIDRAQRYRFVMLRSASFDARRTHRDMNHSHMAYFFQVRDRVEVRRQIYREPSGNIRPPFRGRPLLRLPVCAAHHTHFCACISHLK